MLQIMLMTFNVGSQWGQNLQRSNYCLLQKMSYFKGFMTGQALGKQWTDDKIILPTWFDHLKGIFFLRISVQKGFAHLLYHFPPCWKC